MDSWETAIYNNLTVSPNSSYSVSDSRDFNNVTPPCISERSQAVVGLTITSFGIPINLTFMIVVARVRFMRTVTNAYLVNVAVADMLHLITHWSTWFCSCLDKQLCPLRTDRYALCVAVAINRIVQFASLLTITLLAFHRYMAMCQPMLYKRGILHRPRVVVTIISAIWVCSFLLSAETVLQCVAFRHRTIGPLVFMIVLLASLVVTVVFYNLIMCGLRKIARKINRNRHNGGTTSSWRGRDKDIIMLCLITTAVHFFCMLPFIFHTLDILVNYEHPNRWLSNDCTSFIVMNVATYCLEINSSVNPIIYNALSSEYRKAFRIAFFKK